MSKVAEMPKQEKPAPEADGVADDPTASRLQGRLEILRSLGATA